MQARVGILQFGEVLHVRAGDVQDKEIHEIIEYRKGFLIVLVSDFIWRGGIFGDAGCHPAPDGLVLDKMVGRIAGALVVYAHTVDYGLVLGQSEAAGLGVAVLRLWREGAYFYEREAEIGQVVVHIAVLVETCSKADGVLEGNSEQLALESLGVRGIDPAKYSTAHRYAPAEFQQVHRHPVNLLGLDEEEDGAEQLIHTRQK